MSAFLSVRRLMSAVALIILVFVLTAVLAACGDGESGSEESITEVAASADPAAFCSEAARLDTINDGDNESSPQERTAALETMQSLAPIAPEEISVELQALIDNELQMMSGVAEFDVMTGEMRFAEPVPGAERWEVVKSYLTGVCGLNDPVLIGVPLVIPE